MAPGLSQSRITTLQRRRGGRISPSRGIGSFLTTRGAAVLFSSALLAAILHSTGNLHRLLSDDADAGLAGLVRGHQAGGPGTRRTTTAAVTTTSESESALFNPSQFRTPSYVNLPVNAETSNNTVDGAVHEAMSHPPGEPYGLLHESHPPGHDVVMGLAAYPRNMGGFTSVVSTLRNAGYDGHIILGVHASIPENEARFLRNNDVTFYAVEFVNCSASILDAGEFEGAIRGKCSKGLEELKLEWGRFEMARQWLDKCKECTGWAMVMDTRDIFFQGHPFKHLPDPATAEKELLFVEEIAPHTNPKKDEMPWRATKIDNGRYRGLTEPCYGKDHWRDFSERPVLCSGTVIGTRKGMHRFLSVLVSAFRTNNAKTNNKCRSPSTTDQWTMNYLYYTGAFGYYSRTATLPWGTGPILTIGAPCVNDRIDHSPETPSHSQKDLTEFSPSPDNLILNNWEEEGSGFRVAPGVHQYDRCWRWIVKWKSEHRELFDKKGTDRADYTKKGGDSAAASGNNTLLIH